MDRVPENTVEVPNKLPDITIMNDTNMHAMFYQARTFNQDISKWDTSQVESHEGFSENTSLEWTPNKKPRFDD